MIEKDKWFHFIVCYSLVAVVFIVFQIGQRTQFFPRCQDAIQRQRQHQEQEQQQQEQEQRNQQNSSSSTSSADCFVFLKLVSYSFIISFTIGLLKEAADATILKNRGRTPDAMDILADFIGSISGAITLITLIPLFHHIHGQQKRNNNNNNNNSHAKKDKTDIVFKSDG